MFERVAGNVIDEDHDQRGPAPKINVADTIYTRHQARLIIDNSVALRPVPIDRNISFGGPLNGQSALSPLWPPH
jgi:hypothetical protein